MKDEKDQEVVGRRTLLTNMGVAAVAGMAVSASSVPAQAQSAEFQPQRHSQDSWMNDLGRTHRVFVDSSTRAGGANAMRYANNIITAHREAYEGEASDYGLIVCFRHGSTPYGYNDAIWEKYGANLDRRADPAPITNPMNTAHSANGQNTIASLAEQGVQIAVCSRATRGLSGMLARATGATTDEVYAEIAASLMPNARLVPAGVLAATRSQEYGYSLLYAE